MSGWPSGRRRMAPPGWMPMRPAVGWSTVRTATGTRVSSAAATWSQPGSAALVITARPSPSRSRVEILRSRCCSQWWGMRPLRSQGRACSAVCLRPFGSAERVTLCRPTGRRSAWSLMVGRRLSLVTIAPARVSAVFGESASRSRIAWSGRLVGVRCHRLNDSPRRADWHQGKYTDPVRISAALFSRATMRW
jgi:hypothetical protein